MRTLPHLLLCLLAAASAEEFGEGQAEISPATAVARAAGTWTVTYTVGPSGIRRGGGLRLGLSSFPTRVFETPQVRDPKAPNYLTASASRGGVALDVDVRKELRGGWMRMEFAVVTLSRGDLTEGDTISVVYGDRRGGSVGGRTQRGGELEKVEVTTYVDSKGNGKYRRISAQPKLDIVGLAAARLDVFAPSIVQAGQPFDVSVVAKDKWKNVAMDFGGTVQVECPQAQGFEPISVTFPKEGRAAELIAARLDTEGVYTLKAATRGAESAPRRVPAADFLASTPRRDEDPGFRPELIAVEMPGTQARPGDSFRLTALWRNSGTAAARHDYRISMHLAKAPGTGRAAANWDCDPSAPTSQWRPQETIPASQTCVVPSHLAEGEYVIRVGLYRTLGPRAWHSVTCHQVCTLQVRRSAPRMRYVAPGESNPVLVVRDRPDMFLYWGDTHVHTEHSGDAAGSVHRMYHYAREVARLDFAAASDHVSWKYPKWRWREIQVAAANHNLPNDFVSILGYEWSNQFHGDKNVYFRNDYEDVYVPKSGQAEDFYKMLKGREVVVIPHHPAYPIGLRGMDWTRVDTDLVRLVEMCSAHGTGEYFGNPDGYGRNKNMGPSLPGGFTQDALKRGLKVGMIASSDDHSAHAGRNGFLAALYAPRLTRDDLFDALRSRRCYGTTGARIIVDFRVNDGRLGSEIESAPPPRIRARVIGTSDLDRVELVKSGSVIYVRQGSGREVDFTFFDAQFAEPSAWYYLRVRQRDGARAWTSPVWVTSTRPFPDPAIEKIEVSPAEPSAGQRAEVQITVANRGKRDAPAGRVAVTVDGPAWSVVPSESQPVGGGIGGLMGRRGFQLWRYRADECSVNVFMRWGGGKEDARFTGTVTVHGAKKCHFTPFHFEEEDQLRDDAEGRISWNTNAEAKTGDGMNLWAQAVPGRPAWIEVDVQRDGARYPAEVFSRTGKVQSLPFRVALTQTNPHAREHVLNVPALRAGERKVLTLPLRLDEAKETMLAAAVQPVQGVTQADPGNDRATVVVRVRR